MTSNPPINLLLTYNCGNVFQFEYTLICARTAGSFKMLKYPNLFTFCCFNTAMVALLNLHLGSSGVPFIKSMMGAAAMIFLILAFNASIDSFSSSFAEPLTLSFLTLGCNDMAVFEWFANCSTALTVFGTF